MDLSRGMARVMLSLGMLSKGCKGLNLSVSYDKIVRIERSIVVNLLNERSTYFELHSSL